MIYLLAHVVHDVYRFFGGNRARTLIVAAILLVLHPRFRKNFWRHRLRYSLASLPSAKRHGGILVAKSLREQGVRLLFTSNECINDPVVSAAKVCGGALH